MLNQTQLWAIFDGTIVTLEIAIVAIIFGAIFGVIIALGRISKNKILNDFHGSISGSSEEHHSYCNYSLSFTRYRLFIWI